MFKKKLVNTVMYSCITIRTGTNRTPMLEHIVKMVNGLSSWLFSVGALS